MKQVSGREQADGGWDLGREGKGWWDEEEEEDKGDDRFDPLAALLLAMAQCMAIPSWAGSRNCQLFKIQFIVCATAQENISGASMIYLLRLWTGLPPLSGHIFNLQLTLLLKIIVTECNDKHHLCLSITFSHRFSSRRPS